MASWHGYEKVATHVNNHPPGGTRAEMEDSVELNLVEFIGVMKVTPVFAKCEPLMIYGHWTLKNDAEMPFKMWCDENLYKHGINERICEVHRIDKVIK